ncbi:MAG: TolC family protein [Treponemataceae bacterium]|nr:TolC family protein [Treponemataceae bacterium]
MRIKNISVLSALLLCTASVFAEKITMEDAVDMAVKNNPDLKKQQYTLNNAKRQNFNMWNQFLPSMSTSGLYTNTHDFDEYSEWSWNVGASASLSFGLSTITSMDSLSLNYKSEILNYNNVEAKTKASVSTAFFSLIAEQKNLEILKDSQHLAKELYEQTLKNYNSGLASELDMLNSQYSYLSIEPSIQQAQSSYDSNLASFGLTIGKEDVSELELVGDLNTPEYKFPDTEKIVETYLERRYDVQSAEIAVRLAKASKLTTMSSYQIPTLNLTEKLTVAEKTGLNAEDPEVGVTGAFSVSVNIPLSGWIPGSSESLAVMQKSDAVKTAQITADETKKSAKNDIVSKIAAIKRIWNSLEVAGLNEKISKRSYELSQEGYNAGLISQTDLESSRQKYVSAKQSVLQSKIDYLSAVYSAAQALNISMEEFNTTFGGSL